MKGLGGVLSEKSPGGHPAGKPNQDFEDGEEHMNVLTLDTIIQRLPPGRARTRYQRLASHLGEATILTVPYCDQPLWLVSDPEGARLLVSKGVSRWRIWTLSELTEYLGAFGTWIRSLDQAAEALRNTPQ